jgi:hypothetical protein
MWSETSGESELRIDLACCSLGFGSPFFFLRCFLFLACLRVLAEKT